MAFYAKALSHPTSYLPQVVPIRLGIVACEIFKRELEKLTEGDSDFVHREYLEFALHIDSAILKSTVQEKVNALEGELDAVFLGYGYCQSLQGLTKTLRTPTVMLEVDDCISAFLTPLEYAKEKAVCTGTWFSSPGWAEKGMESVIKELHLDSALDQGYDAMYFARILFQGYSRCLFIDTGVEDRKRFEQQSREFADQLELRHDSRGGTLTILEDGLRRTKELARSGSAPPHAVPDVRHDSND